MTQDHSYPDPGQLRKFAEEPMPFDDILPGDLDLDDDGHYVATVENVTYDYHPTYINVEVEDGEWEQVSDLSWCDLTHVEAADRYMHMEIQEDFICESGMVTMPNGDPAQFEAFWILEEICIQNPKLYA